MSKRKTLNRCYDKEAVLTDWRSGCYDVEMLVGKYSISKSTVYNLTKKIPHDLAPHIKKKVEVHHKDLTLTKVETRVVRAESERLLDEMDEAEVIYELTLRNMKGLWPKLENAGKMTINDHKLAQEAIDKASVTVKVNERFNKAADTQVNVQNNVTTSIGFKGVDVAD